MKFKMQNKILSFIVLSIILFPNISSAGIIGDFDILINIHISSEGKNALFNFSIDDYWNSQEISTFPFSIMTESYVGSTTFGKGFYDNNSYLIKLENVQDIEAYQEGMQDYPIIEGFKFDNIFCTSNNPNDLFLVQENSVMLFPIKDEVIDCYFSKNAQTQAKTPVLIVPGIMGTEIYDGKNLLWPNVGKMINDIGDEFMDSLQFNNELSPTNAGLEIGNIVGSPAINQHFYDLLANEFIAQGYIENETLFAFPYDWRYGVSGVYDDGNTNVDLLKNKINEILSQTRASKIDIVAHSNGGLLVKKYVMDNFTEDNATHKINKAVFVGVPNTGAPKAIKALLQGDDYGVKIGPVGVLSEKEMKKIAKNMPVAYDLLPSENYRHFVGGFITQIDIGYGSIADGVETDLNYQEFEKYMINEKGLNQYAFDNSQNLHTQAFDNYDLRNAGVDIYAIDGCKTPTLANFLEIKSKNILGQESTKFGKLDLKTGDGTVTIQSSTNLPIDQSHKFYAINSDHGKMPSANGIRQKIVNIISGSNLSIDQNIITQNVDDCQLNGVGFSVFSPVDIFITDQNGNRLGLNENGDIVNEIIGADFQVWGEHKFIFVPTDAGQTYITTLTGTGTGTYTINVENIENNQTTQVEVFSNLPVTTSLTGTVNLSNGVTPTTLTIKESPASQIQTILPDSIVIGEQVDFISPASAVTLIGAKDQNGIYNSDIKVEITAKDNENGVGVLSLQYNLDNAVFQKVSGSAINFSVLTEGKHKVEFFSTDKLGNNEQVKLIEFEIKKEAIDTIPPEAIIEFDPIKKDLKFTPLRQGFAGQAEFDPDVVIKDQDDTITLTDKAGNTTEIKLKDKNRKITMKAEIKSIKYNNKLVDTSNNQMNFLWLYDKKSNLKMLTQRVMSKNGYNILAIYNGANTTLFGKDKSGYIMKTEKGLKILKVTTDNGNLNWNY